MIRSASGYGSGRSRTALTMLKMAVFAPIPSARVMIATAENAGFLISWRTANRRLFMTTIQCGCFSNCRNANRTSSSIESLSIRCFFGCRMNRDFSSGGGEAHGFAAAVQCAAQLLATDIGSFNWQTTFDFPNARLRFNRQGGVGGNGEVDAAGARF